MNTGRSDLETTPILSLYLLKQSTQPLSSMPVQFETMELLYILYMEVVWGCLTFPSLSMGTHWLYHLLVCWSSCLPAFILRLHIQVSTEGSKVHGSTGPHWSNSLSSGPLCFLQQIVLYLQDRVTDRNNLKVEEVIESYLQK